jgi:hypothetical protein
VGALTGGITTTAYYVEGDLPKGFREPFVEAMNQSRFKEIEVEGDQTESHGWVDIQNPFSESLRIDTVHWNAYFLFGMRHDTLRIPASLFKMHLNKRLDDYKAEFGKDRITKADRDNVSGLLEREMRRKVLPGVKVHDVAWNLDRKELWLFTTNKYARQLFEELFDKTFGLNLIVRNPYSRLERLGLDEAALTKAASLDASLFAVPPEA